MEGYKDLVLSQAPPARAGGYQPTTHIGNFENYKGILLCDRPCDHHTTVGTQPPFLPPGATDDSVGLPPSAEQLKRLQEARRGTQKKKAPTALTQHRKALKALNELKAQEKAELVEASIEEDKRRERFQQKQAQLRQVMLAGCASDGPEAVIDAIAPGVDPAQVTMKATRPSSSRSEDRLPPVGPPPIAYVKSPMAADRDTGEKTKVKTKKKSSKPKWAMTEEEALDAELQATDDLIKFAAGLDFEKYMDDYEIQEALSIMRERVEELKSEEAKERGEDPENQHEQGTRHAEHDGSTTKVWVPTGRRELLHRRLRGDLAAGEDLERMEREWDSVSNFSNLSDKKRKLLSDQAMLLAEKILSGSSQLRGIHSKQSLARLLEDLTHKVYNDEKAGRRVPMDIGSAVQQPVIAIHQPTQYPTEPPRVLVQLKKAPDYVQNLPYMYRCPSI